MPLQNPYPHVTTHACSGIIAAPIFLADASDQIFPHARTSGLNAIASKMAILHVALAKLDKSLLKQTEEDTYRQMRLMLDAVPVPKHDVHVGPPLIPRSTRGYDIMLSIKFDKLEDFKAYLAHSKHIEMLKVFGPLLRDMITYQVDGAAPESKL